MVSLFRLFTAIMVASTLLAGCTNIIHATTDKPFQPDPSETPIGTDINDWQLETLIGVNIKKAHPTLEISHINVHAYNGVVLLTGEVPSNELLSLAGQTARDFRGVRQVYNELETKGVTSFLARTNDTWLTTKVKTKLIADNQVKASKLKVVTESGVIYLMGVVPRAIAERAANIASNTKGAQRVVKVIEYLD